MEEKKKISCARSKENGIVFYSNKVPVLCYEAYLDKKGEIQTRLLPSKISEWKDYCGMFITVSDEHRKNFIKCLKGILLVFAILSIIATKNFSIALGLVYFSFLAVEDVVDFGIAAFEIKRGSLKSTGRFHSAEHMAIAAYKKYQRVPTMEEVKKSSRLDKECGSRIIIDPIMLLILLVMIMCSCAYISLFAYFALAAIFIVFVIIEKRYNFFRVFQVLVTNKPTDKELEVALAGIKMFEEMETQLPDIGMPMGMVIMEFHCSDNDEHNAETD